MSAGRDDGVSVILTVLNEREGLRRLLGALLSQTRPPDEIVVVDGGSTDGTLDVLREQEAADPRVRVYVEPGVNIARGRNLAIARARGPIIAVTDGGCVPERDWLEELVRPLIEDPSVGAVGGDFLVGWRTRFEFFAGLLSRPKDSGDPATRLFYGRSSAFRKTVWEAAGGYPEWLYTGEDTLFAVRVRELGYSTAFAPASRLAWRPRPTLRKLAKMFFLYGRGNGRADLVDMAGLRYHLRNYGLLLASAGAGFWLPPLWLVSAGILVLLVRMTVVPAVRKVRGETSDPRLYLYVPVIVLVRHAATTSGSLLGVLEYRYRRPFHSELARYRSVGSIGAASVAEDRTQ